MDDDETNDKRRAALQAEQGPTNATALDAGNVSDRRRADVKNRRIEKIFNEFLWGYRKTARAFVDIFKENRDFAKKKVAQNRYIWYNALRRFDAAQI